MSRNKVRIVFFGTPEFAVPSLERLLAEPTFEVLAVVTQPDKRRGRGSQVIPSLVKAVASANNLPVWEPKNIKRDPETLAKLQELQADVFVVVAYGQILSQEVLDIPRLGCINCHGSILPQYRGAAPIQWSLYHGEAETGITTMLMDAGMDTGPMVLKSHITIKLLDDAQMVAATLSVVGADFLVETLQKLQRQDVKPIPQDSSQATYAPLIRKPDYLLDWSRPAIQLHNQIRGFFPNCMALFRGSPLKITATAPLGAAYWPLLPAELKALEADWPDADLSSNSPGSVVGLVKQLGPVIQTGQGVLLLREVQPAGKRSQSGWDFVNGVRLAVGEYLANGQ